MKKDTVKDNKRWRSKLFNTLEEIKRSDHKSEERSRCIIALNQSISWLGIDLNKTQGYK